MAILEVVGGDRGYRISFTCSQNRDEGGVQGTNRKVVVLLGSLFGIANVVYLSLVLRVGIRIQGTPSRVQREMLIIRMYEQKMRKQCKIKQDPTFCLKNKHRGCLKLAWNWKRLKLATKHPLDQKFAPWERNSTKVFTAFTPLWISASSCSGENEWLKDILISVARSSLLMQCFWASFYRSRS